MVNFCSCGVGGAAVTSGPVAAAVAVAKALTGGKAMLGSPIKTVFVAASL